MTFPHKQKLIHEISCILVKHGFISNIHPIIISHEILNKIIDELPNPVKIEITKQELSMGLDGVIHKNLEYKEFIDYSKTYYKKLLSYRNG